MNTSLVKRNGLSSPTRLLKMFNEPFLDSFMDWPFETKQWNEPKANLEELEDKYQLTMEAPGLSKENLNVEFHNNYLTVSSTYENNHEETKKNYRLQEITRQNFSRKFYFDDGAVDSEGIEATFKDGILTINLKKTGKQLQRRIEVQ